jgi:hypothetical protein
MVGSRPSQRFFCPCFWIGLINDETRKNTNADTGTRRRPTNGEAVASAFVKKEVRILTLGNFQTGAKIQEKCKYSITTASASDHHQCLSAPPKDGFRHAIGTLSSAENASFASR